MRVRVSHAVLDHNSNVDRVFANAQSRRVAWITGESDDSQLEAVRSSAFDHNYSLWSPELEGHGESTAWIAVRKDLLGEDVQRNVYQVRGRNDPSEFLPEVLLLRFESPRTGKVAVVTAQSQSETSSTELEEINSLVDELRADGFTVFHGGRYPEFPIYEGFDWDSYFVGQISDNDLVVVASRGVEQTPNVMDQSSKEPVVVFSLS